VGCHFVSIFWRQIILEFPLIEHSWDVLRSAFHRWSSYCSGGCDSVFAQSDNPKHFCAAGMSFAASKMLYRIKIWTAFLTLLCRTDMFQLTTTPLTSYFLLSLAAGWDPCTGLGAPNYPTMEDLVFAVWGINASFALCNWTPHPKKCIWHVCADGMLFQASANRHFLLTWIKMLYNQRPGNCGGFQRQATLRVRIETAA
jgi:hypothetical protein